MEKIAQDSQRFKLQKYPNCYIKLWLPRRMRTAHRLQIGVDTERQPKQSVGTGAAGGETVTNTVSDKHNKQNK